MLSSVRTPDNSVCVVLGGGLHAKVVIDAMHAAGTTPFGVLDAERSRWGSDLLGVQILGGDELLEGLKDRGVRTFTVGIGSTGDSRLRRQLFTRAIQCGLLPMMIRHPAAIISPSAVLHDGAQILAGAIINPCAEIGVNSIVNTGAIVEHDCQIGAHAHVAPGSRLGGSVKVGDDAHVGLGATVRQNLQIGPRAIVGAGAVVVDDVPADVIVMGVPARVYRSRAA